MRKFRDMFKVRQPGNGDGVQKGFEADSKKSQAWGVPHEDNSQNSGGKTLVNLGNDTEGNS